MAEISDLPVGAKRQHEPNENLWLILAVVLFVMASWGLTIFYLGPLDPVTRGTFGDMFGAVNALFSGRGFAGILYTLHLQRRQLKIQMEELQVAREEHSAQQRELDRQAWRTDFQSILDRFESVVASVSVCIAKEANVKSNVQASISDDGEAVYYGRDAFKVAQRTLKTYWEWMPALEKNSNMQDNIKFVFKHCIPNFEIDFFRFVRAVDLLSEQAWRAPLQGQHSGSHRDAIVTVLSEEQRVIYFYLNIIRPASERSFAEGLGLFYGLDERMLFEASAHSTLYKEIAYSRVTQSA